MRERQKAMPLRGLNVVCDLHKVISNRGCFQNFGSEGNSDRYVGSEKVVEKVLIVAFYLKTARVNSTEETLEAYDYHRFLLSSHRV